MLRLLSAGLLVVCCLQVTVCKEYEHHDKHHPVHSEHYGEDGEHNFDFDHEAVTGSRKKDYSEMTEEEAVKNLNDIVTKIDVNNDGHVTRDELIDWITKSFINLDKEEATDKLYETDSNMDDQISWEEHLKKTFDYLPEEVEGFEKDENPEVQRTWELISFDKEKFARADQNQDGQLSHEEYAAFLHPHSHDHMKDLELKEILIDYDKDKDGVISFKEFLGEGDEDKKQKKEKHFPASKEDQISEEENFKEYDVNKDMILDKEEIMKWAMPSSEDAAREEADHLIKESDDNKDGQLDRVEILSHQDMWTGSPAAELPTHDPGEL